MNNFKLVLLLTITLLSSAHSLPDSGIQLTELRTGDSLIARNNSLISPSGQFSAFVGADGKLAIVENPIVNWEGEYKRTIKFNSEYEEIAEYNIETYTRRVDLSVPSLWHSPTVVGTLTSDCRFTVYKSGTYELWRSKLARNGQYADCKMVLTDEGVIQITGKETSGSSWTNLQTHNDGFRLYHYQVISGETLSSQTSKFYGEYQLTLQGDGNLVYRKNGVTKWAAGTYGPNMESSWLTAQGDCNVVLYDNSNNAVWSSGTSGAQEMGEAVTDCRMEILTDGSLVIRGKAKKEETCTCMVGSMPACCDKKHKYIKTLSVIYQS